MTSRLLAGLRVVELTEVWAGPMGGSLLGDLGADVIKVESFPRVPAITRPVGPPVPEGEYPMYESFGVHQLANRNKRNIALNLRSPQGAELFTRLLASADIYFEGFSAGTIQRIGFGWEDVHPVNPRLVMISMPGWGLEGPYKGYVTLGSGLDASSGHMSVRGYPNRGTEDIPAVYHSDATGALALVVAALTGVQRREASGEGCFIDLSQVEAMAWQLPALLAEWTLNGRLPVQLGNADPHVVPHGCYPAAGEEAWVVVAAENDAQWAGLARVLGHPEWATDGHPWASVVGRLGARTEIDRAIAGFTAEREPAAVAEAVQAAGAIAAPVVGNVEMLASPQLAARDWFQAVDHVAVGSQIFPGFLWSAAADPPTWDRPSALVGEHNREVIAELGYSPDEITSLEEAGVIGSRYVAPAS